MKKLLAVLLVAIMSISLIGCAQEEAKPVETKQVESKSDTKEEKTEAKADTKEEEKEEAATYPEKPVTVIVTANAGGGTDAMARAVCTPLEQRLGQPMTIINNGGASGLAGMTEIAAAEPDGYTLGVFSISGAPHFVNTVEDVAFGTDDFTYIAGLNLTSDLLILGKDSKFASLDELVAYAKENPGEVTIGLPTAIQMLSLTMVEEGLGVDFTEVIYGGGGKVFADLTGGHVDVGILSAKFVGQSEEQGLDVLGIMLEDRLETYPEVPTFVEQGYDIVNADSRMLVGPKGLPQEVIDTITAELTEGYTAEVRESVLTINEAPVYFDYTTLNALLVNDYAKRNEIYGKLDLNK